MRESKGVLAGEKESVSLRECKGERQRMCEREGVKEKEWKSLREFKSSVRERDWNGKKVYLLICLYSPVLVLNLYVAQTIYLS